MASVSPAPTTTLDRVAHFAATRAAFAAVAVWGFAEAIAFPIVPDVLIGLLVLANPRLGFRLFVALVAGALAGTTVLWLACLAAPGRIETMLLALPGIDQTMIASAHATVAGSSPLSIASFGPGIPLKVFTFAWATGPATPLALAVGVVLNRATRIGAPLVLLALVGVAAPSFLRRHERLVLVAYAAFFVVTYALYWT